MMKKSPFLIFAIVFIALMVITQYLVYQQYSLRKERRRTELDHELTVAKDKFSDILNSSLVSANALALIHKEFGLQKNFDSIASSIMNTNKEIDMVGLTDRFIVTKVYPLKGNESNVGFDLRTDSVRYKEVLRAFGKDRLFYAGPFPSRNKALGNVIFARVPVFMNDTFAAITLVRVKLSTIEKALEFNRSTNKFVYQLSKINAYSHQTEYFFTKFTPENYENAVSVHIPEGDWTLHAAYNKVYSENIFPFYGAIIGFLFSLLTGILFYYRAKEPEELKKILGIKTHALNERVKELSTIYNLNAILQQKNKCSDDIFKEIVDIIPPGWQYPDICEAKITFNNKTYTTKGYTNSDLKLSSDFNLSDGRKGTIEVVYTKQGNSDAIAPFLNEERDLIKAISETIEVFLNKIIHEEALEQSEAKFRGAFENSAIGMTLASLKGEYIKVNNAICEMLGYSREEFLKLTYLDITHKDDLPKDKEYLKDTLAGKTDLYKVEKRYIHKNETIVWVNLNSALVKDVDGTPQYFVTQIENITEKKKTAQQLIESEKRFRETLNLLPQSVFEVDTNGKITFANQAGLELYGFSKEEFEKGISIRDLLVPEDLERAHNNVMQIMNGEMKVGGREYRNIKKDGTIFPYMVYSSVIKKDGVVTGIRSVGFDMTEQRKNEAAINELMQLNFKKEKEVEKTKAVALMEGQENERLRISREIHDGIGQMMTAIKISSDSIDLDSKDGESERTKLEYTRSLIAEVITELRQVSSDLSPTFLYDYGLFLSINQMAIKVTKIGVTQVHLSSNVQQVRFNALVEITFYRIVQEAVNNALKYAEARNIHIHLIQDAEFLELTITDDGKGFDVERTYNDPKRGHGLRNMNSRANLVNALFNITSESGKGVQLTLQMPHAQS